ncbi:AAA family ATPase [Actinopolymorpha singaporensis]|uniref:Shikimate kinase n=1 Tax=Actinopolymorpha singaporensis TaxID=117157 RepID=A0A1H1RHL7_9ACTN|nr:AAA family ATPase [Actinopolymorpha singaporensis]SDS34389.1 Shikimate kinase [Actinopolymorpha singaporensis]
MARVLVTGMSGAGKSTVLEELRRRGVLTVDTDYDGWVLSDGNWDEPRMAGLLAAHHQVVVSGTVANQRHFYDRFEHIVLLTAPLEVLLDRVRRRSNNPYGKSLRQQEQIRQYVEEVEPLLRTGATLELDGRLPVAHLADMLERIVSPAPPAPLPSSVP